MSEYGEQSGLTWIRSIMENRTRSFLGRYTKTAVMVPLVMTELNELAVLFEERAHTLRRQPGEISFPGGHFEPADTSESATAIRETSEELGIPESSIELLGPLDVFAAYSGLLVFPYVGLLLDYPHLHPNCSEVNAVFAVELSRLLASQPEVYRVPLRPNPPDDFPYHRIPNGRDYAWRTMESETWFYEFDGRIIWGLTARILSHFLEVVHSGRGSLRE